MTPTLATVDEDTQGRMVRAGCIALQRLANGEEIERISDDELVGLVALREAEFAAFVTELKRRRLLATN